VNKVKYTLQDKFTQLPNQLINDFRLHPMARFLFSFLACQADTFEFNNAILCKALGGCHGDTLRKYMKELIDAGYVSRERIREDGKLKGWEYSLHPEPTSSENLQHGKKTSSENFKTGKFPTYNKNNSSNKNKDNNNTPYNPPKGEPQKPDQKKSKSAEVREKAEKGLAFFNQIADRDLSSKEHIKAFERAIKRGATGEDIAHATYEQIISTWGDKEAIRKWLTPLTICRPANLTRLCDAWRFRSDAERSKLIRQIHGVGPRTSGYNPTGGASNEGYNLRKLIEKQNAPRYD